MHGYDLTEVEVVPDIRAIVVPVIVSRGNKLLELISCELGIIVLKITGSSTYRGCEMVF